MLPADLQRALDSKTKPIGSLGRLEQLAAQIATLQNTLTPSMSTCQLIIFGADHGIAEQNVSAYPSEVTRQMVLNLLSGGAAANVIAKSLDIPVKIVDAGTKGEPINHPNLINRHIAPGTADFSIGPAMTPDQFRQATQHGANLFPSPSTHDPKRATSRLSFRAKRSGAEESLGRGYTSTDAVCFGEIGIANTASASIVAHKILNIPLPDLVGPGTGLDDAGVQHKLAVLTRSANRTPTHLDAQTALTQYGGFEIAMMTAGIIAAVNAKRLVIIDGFIATSAAIAAINTDSTITNALVFSHRSGERGHDAMLKALNAKPILDLDMRLGEGTGALLAWPIIKSAAAILNDMATFQSANVSTKL